MFAEVESFLGLDLPSFRCHHHKGWHESKAQTPSPPSSPRMENNPLELQQRLVHLYHASNCEQSNASPRQPCRASPRCHELHVLLIHVHQCNDPQCSAEDCMLTKCLLEHYRNCKDTECSLCQPLNRIVERKKMRKNEIRFIHRKSVSSSQQGMDNCAREFHGHSSPGFYQSAYPQQQSSNQVYQEAQMNFCTPIASVPPLQCSSSSSFDQEQYKYPSYPVDISSNNSGGSNPSPYLAYPSSNPSSFSHDDGNRYASRSPPTTDHLPSNFPYYNYMHDMQQHNQQQNFEDSTIEFDDTMLWNNFCEEMSTSVATNNYQNGLCFHCNVGIGNSYRYRCNECSIDVCVNCATSNKTHHHPMQLCCL